MNKKVVFRIGVLSAVFLSFLLASSVNVYAEPMSKNEYKKSISITDRMFESTKVGENAILAKSGTVNFSKSQIVKSGDDNSREDEYHYGTNAAVLSIDSSKIKIMNSTIMTNGKNSSAAVAYGDSTIDISSDTAITTKKEGSTAAKAVDGGTIILDGVEIETDVSEGAMIVDGGSIKIDNSKFETNTVISIHNSSAKSMDDEASIVSVNMTDIKNKKGDVFFVTNASARISLERTTLANDDKDGAILRIAASKWGKKNNNGGDVDFTTKYQPMEGVLRVDGLSVLRLNLLQRSSLYGAINPDNKAKRVDLMLDMKSRLILTEDSYVSTLLNEVRDNANIYANGHKLFVNGTEAKINIGKWEEWEYDFSTETTELMKPVVEEEPEDKTALYVMLGISSGAFLLSLLSVFVIIRINRNKKQRQAEKDAILRVKNNIMKKPWEKA